LPAIMTNSVKVLIVEERNLLREKIAGILSREDTISMVVQVSSYSKLQTVLEETMPDLFLGDFFEFNKFCNKKGIVPGDLCPAGNILLYTDEYRRLDRIEVGHPEKQKIFDVRRVQEEVSCFLKDKKQRKQNVKNKKSAP
jgi:hypothetical protein